LNQDIGNSARRGKAPSHRQLRVGEELRHALSRILARGELRDPSLADLNLTVTEVRLSPDLKNATAFVVPLGGSGLEAAVAALNRAGGFFRSRLAREVALRHAPRVAFAPDRSFDEARRVDEILERPRVRRDLVADSRAADSRAADSRATDSGAGSPGPDETDSDEVGDDHGA
jgi:ribosome-binding factor A